MSCLRWRTFAISIVTDPVITPNSSAGGCECAASAL